MNQLKAILSSPDNIMQYIGEKFRVYDMICLLSTGFVSEEVLFYYQKLLGDGVQDLKFIKPATFSYLQQFGYGSCADIREGDWASTTHCFWPINCTPTHWTCAVHSMSDNAKVVYMDTIGCLTTIKRKCPLDLIPQISKVMECNAPGHKLYPRICVLNPAVFPRQEGNDCGPCVNFLATMFARDPDTFHGMLKMKYTAFEFPPSHEMRIDQAKEIFDFLMPEVMDP